MADRTAHVTWSGSLIEGGGTITNVGSGAFGPLEVTWASRAEESDGRTSPEELIAAAHAACFSMALSHGLAQGGTPPDRLDVDATVTFVPGTGITKIELAVDATVPGIDEDAFRAAAETAKENCPVSTALASVPEITLDATLSQPTAGVAVASSRATALRFEDPFGFRWVLQRPDAEFRSSGQIAGRWLDV